MCGRLLLCTDPPLVPAPNNPFSMSVLSCRNSHHVWFGRSLMPAKLEAVTWPVFLSWVRQMPWVGQKASDSCINLGQDGWFFDQLLSSNISVQCFHTDRNWSETELNKDNIKVVRWQRGTIHPQIVPHTEELCCTRSPLAQLAGTNIFHFSKPSGMSLQGPLEKKPAPWIEAEQDGRNLC